MFVRRKAQNGYRMLVQLYGSAAAKRHLWNTEFGGGRWKCLEDTAGDCIYPFVETHAHHGSILDLGCGSGSTAVDLADASYTSYVGVDISDVALEHARARSARNGRTAKNTFCQSDISTFTPNGQFDVILFRDSLCYIPRPRIVPVLHRYAQYLRPGAVFVLRLANGDEKYRAILTLVEKHFTIVERTSFFNPDAVVMVFRP